MADKKYMVWVRANGKLHPQVWFHNPSNHKPMESGLSTIVEHHEISENHYNLGVSALAELYPMTEATK
jgi:hypothetical protein